MILLFLNNCNMYLIYHASGFERIRNWKEYVQVLLNASENIGSIYFIAIRQWISKSSNHRSLWLTIFSSDTRIGNPSLDEFKRKGGGGDLNQTDVSLSKLFNNLSSWCACLFSFKLSVESSEHIFTSAHQNKLCQDR